MRTDILGHPPSLCNCRRVWHPCHTHATSQGVHLSQVHQQSKKCTNKAATASSHSKRLLCILRVPWNNTTQPKHLCASVPSVGGLFRAATRTHPGGAAVSAAPTEQPLHPSTEFTEFSCRGELLCVLCILWDNAHPKHLCVSVPSVGEYDHGRWRGYGRDAIPS